MHLEARGVATEIREAIREIGGLLPLLQVSDPVLKARLYEEIGVLYTAESLVLDAAGLVPAEGRADASVVVRWTSEPTLLSAAPRWPREVDGIPVTDPVQQWWDLLDLCDLRSLAESLTRAGFADIEIDSDRYSVRGREP